MKEKREIHLAVSKTQLVALEQALIKSASHVLSLSGEWPTSAYLNDTYVDIMNLIHQVKKERKRV